ncbi:NAD/FAD-utilizing enzyme [Ferrimonas gelatinilytica]|uniref:Magnesium transporter n=1 Tax=Ferrimonas gelatinilytica TaxID=1255257 RepID=A0ABP9RWD9_9GAMM
MKFMVRHYYLSDSLWELEWIERQLEGQGFSPAQIHVLSQQPGLAARFRLLPLSEFWLYDLPHYLTRGLALGLVLAGGVLLGVAYSGWHEAVGSWLPFTMLALMVLGFCTWEGGLIGLQSPHHHFGQFHRAIDSGQHLLLVDVEDRQESTLNGIMRSHPMIRPRGTSRGAHPGWVKMEHWWLQRRRPVQAKD